MADKSQTRMRVACNFIKTYGRVRFSSSAYPPRSRHQWSKNC